jgi:hypothetical protein
MSIVLIAIGALAMISGEADDSPGLQGLGLILILAVIFLAYRRWKTK